MEVTLNKQTPQVMYLCSKDKRLAKVIDMVGEITYSTHNDGYAFLIHEIIEQMLSIKAGAKIYGRLSELCLGHITPESISNLSDEEIRGTGTSSSKVSYIRSLTQAVTTGRLILDKLPNLKDDDVITQLTAIKGIGQWTAKMYLIFVLNRADVLPIEDVAFLQSYKWLYKTDDVSKESIQRKWKPYSSIAARFMYRALDMGLTKEEFHLFADKI